MNTQEIINELTKQDRLSVKEVLKKKYSPTYVNYMFRNKRRRTDLFRKTVWAYWEVKKVLTEKVEEFIHELNNNEELV